MADDTHRMASPVTVPEGWTADQAEAVLDFLFALETAVFNAYERALVERAIREANGPHPAGVDCVADLEADADDLPF